MFRRMSGKIRGFCAWGFIGLFSLTCMSCIPAFQGLRPITKQELGAKKTRGAAEVLFLEDYRKIRYGQIGQSSLTTFWRVYKRVRINKRKGFPAATETLRGGKLTRLEVRTQCPDGRVTRMGLKDIQKTSKTSYSSGIWNFSSKSYTFTAAGVGVGCVIDFFWEMDRSGASVPRWGLSNRYPIHKAHYSFEYKEGNVYRASLKDMYQVYMRLPRWGAKKARKVEDKSSVVEKDKNAVAEKKKARELRVRLKHDRSARRIQLWLRKLPAALPGKTLQKFIVKSMFPIYVMKQPFCAIELLQEKGLRSRDHLMAWKNIDASFTTPSSLLREDRSKRQKNYQQDELEERAQGALARLARSLTQKVPNHQGKLWKLYNHLRFTMSSSGAGLDSSNRLSKIYQLRRGNNYEINLIYIVMLRSLGIRAYLALLAPNNQNYQNLPPSRPFKRVGTYIAPGSQSKWRGIYKERAALRHFLAQQKSSYAGARRIKGGVVVDPSNKTLPFGMLPDALQGTTAFLIDGGGGRFFKLRTSSKKRNTLSINGEIKIQKNGAVRGTFERHLGGLYAYQVRTKIHQKSLKKWRESDLGKTIRKSCGAHSNISLKQAPQLALATLREPLSYSLNFSTPACFSTGKRSLLFPLLPLNLFYLPKTQSKKRTMPIILGWPKTIVLKLNITYPEGYTAHKVPANQTFKGPSLRATVETKKRPNGLQVHVRFQSTQEMLPTKQLAKVNAFFNQLRKLLERKIYISAGS